MTTPSPCLLTKYHKEFQQTVSQNLGDKNDILKLLSYREESENISIGRRFADFDFMSKEPLKDQCRAILKRTLESRDFIIKIAEESKAIEHPYVCCIIIHCKDKWLFDPLIHIHRGKPKIDPEKWKTPKDVIEKWIAKQINKTHHGRAMIMDFHTDCDEDPDRILYIDSIPPAGSKRIDLWGE